MQRPSLRDIATLATMAAAGLTLSLPATQGGHGASGIVFVCLLLLTGFVEALPVDLPDRAGVTLSVLPAALLWYYCGAFVAITACGAAVAITRLVRRQPGAALSSAIVMVSIWVAQALATAPHALPIMGRVPQLGLFFFCADFALTAPLLAWLTGDDDAHPEPLSSLIMAPLALMLVGLSAAALPIGLPLAGLLLLLVRGNVNAATLRRRVAALAGDNAAIVRALAVERDTSAAIVNFSGDGMFTVDKELRIRHFNPALAALTRQDATKVIGRPAEEVLGRQHAPAAIGDGLRRALHGGRALHVDSILETTEGQIELATSYSAIPDAEGNVALCVGVVRDVTREREEARAREDYFSLVTHDLRNPLTAIVGNTHLLNQELARLPTEATAARRLVERIEKANDQLMRLVNGLLELQRLESSPVLLQTHPVDLRPLADELIAEFRAAAQERGQILRVSGPDLCARADPLWCHEIVANLLSNAIKYTPNGGVISLALEARGAHVAVSVTDSGHGLTSQEMEKLFTRFFRSKRPELRAARGTGLGLALAKRMAERMGGDIAVRSTVGAGSTFTLLLPLGDLPPFLERRNNETSDETRKNAEIEETLELVINGQPAVATEG